MRHLAAAALALILIASTLHAAEPARQPNVIVILADDIGWNGLGVTGSDLYQTPNLDRLAREGMVFTSGYAACTVCSPTRAALMTGKYPARLRITDWIPGQNAAGRRLALPDWTKQLPLEERTVAELFKEAGYATAIVGKWHLGGEGFEPERQGFDVNIGATAAGSPPGGYFLPNKLDLADARDGEYLTDYLGRKAAELIERWKDRPFFLYLPHYAVHTPIQAKADLVSKYQQRLKPGLMHDNATYAAMTESLDDAVGAVMNKLDELKLTDHTLILFTGDNGGLSHKGGKATGITLNDPLRRGKGSAYEGGVREPYIVRWPGVIKPGSRCDVPVMSIDILPTAAEILGATLPAHVDGRSILPLLRDPQAKLDRDLFWHYPHYHAGGDSPYGAIRSGDWKLIEFYEDMRVELYNLADDLGEKNDLAASNPAKAAALRQKLHAWRASVTAQMPTPNPDYREGAPPTKRPAKRKKKAA